MDIQYLLMLQSLRIQLGGGLAGFFTVVSNLSAGMFLWLPACLLFWGGKKRAGRSLFLTMGLGLFVTNLLKLTFCAPRPWVRSAAIHPLAFPGGYSFPSAHSTAAACNYGGLARECRGHRALAALLFAMIPLTMLSRNILGVHTPQDVLAGCGVGLLMVFLVPKLCRWLEGERGREQWLPVFAITLTVVGLLYIGLKPYPTGADSLSAMDPARMKLSGCRAAGQLFGLVTGLWFESRFVGFSPDSPMGSRALRCGVGLLLLLLLEGRLVPAGAAAIGGGAGYFAARAVELFLLTGGYPWCFCRLEKARRP